MEAVWNEPGVKQVANLCRWDENGHNYPGELRNPKPSKEALAFRAEVLGGRGWPVWGQNNYGGKNHEWPIYPSEELKARYKEDCPRNYKALIAAFGQTKTKYDA